MLISAVPSPPDPPDVVVVMDPAEPVSEEVKVNVTLVCSVQRANPDSLDRVRWFLDGKLLKVSNSRGKILF